MIRTWHKWALGLLLAVAAVLAIALTLVYANVEPQAYRARIEALASRAVGRDVSIQGPITLSLLPWPSVRMHDVVIANPGPVGSDRLAHVRRVSVSPRPLALLQGRVAVGTVTIDGLSLDLVRDARGRTNWQGVIDAIAAGPGQALGAMAPSRPTPVSTPGLPLSSMAVGSVHIINARIRYDDAASDRHWRLLAGHLQTGRMTDGRPFRLEATGRFSRSHSPTVARAHVVTLIEPHLSDRFYRFSDLGLNLLVDGPGAPGGQQEANLGASGEIDFKAGRFGLDNVSLQASGLSLTGKIDGRGLGSQPIYNGRVTVAAFSPRSVMQQLELPVPRVRAENALTRAGFDAQFEGSADEIRFQQIAAHLDRSHLTGTVRITHFQRPRVAFDLSLDTLDTDDYLPIGKRLPGAFALPASGQDNKRNDTPRWAVLRRASWSGQLDINALTVARVTLSRARVTMSADRTGLVVPSLTAAAYGGRIDLSARIDTTNPVPRFALRGGLGHIALGDLLSDAVASRGIRGRADIDLNLSASGRRRQAMLSSLAGRLDLRLTDGRLPAYDLGAALLGADAPQAASAASADTGTSLRRLAARFVVDHGVAQGHDLQLVTPRLRVTGRGQYDIAANRYNYRLTTVIPDDADHALSALAGRCVPIHLTGSLLAPAPQIGPAACAVRKASPANTALPSESGDGS